MLSVGAGEIHFMDSPREAVMRADDLRSQEVLVSKGMGGFPLFASSRIMVMGTRSLGHMQADMIRILGKENAVAIMGRHGYEAGMATAMAMAELYDWDSDEEWFKAGSILRSMAGLAHEKIFKLLRPACQTAPQNPRTPGFQQARSQRPQ